MQQARRPDTSRSSRQEPDRSQALSRRWRWVCVQLPSRFFSVTFLKRFTDAPVKVGIVMGVLLCKRGPKFPGSQKSGSGCGAAGSNENRS